MSAAREEVLRRIRSALDDVGAAERAQDVAVTRGYRRHADEGEDARLERFAERVRDYHAEVTRVDLAELQSAVAQACAERGLRRIAVPSALPPEWRPDGVEVIEDRGLSAEQLDAIDGALTGCAVAVAETGTLILDGGALSGRRILSLVPDHHICVVSVEQVVSLVPEAVAALGPAVRERGTPITLISGPSASSDIELQRVEGVHGPRNLLVFLAQLRRTE